jgi:hypothetical protein
MTMSRKITLTIELPDSYKEDTASATEHALIEGSLQILDLLDLAESDEEITVQYQVTDQ